MANTRVIGAASLPLIASIALIVAAVFQILAFASTSWAYDTSRFVYVGLWTDGNCNKAEYKGCYIVGHVEYFAEGTVWRITYIILIMDY